MPTYAPLGNLRRKYDDSGNLLGLVDAGGQDASVLASGSVIPAGRLSSPSGLDRWYAALADAQFQPALLRCVGNSLTHGLWGDGAGSTTWANSYLYGFPGQLRTLFASMFGTPSQGHILMGDNKAWPGVAGGYTDSRITAVGGAAGGVGTGFGIAGRSRLMSSTNTLTISMPSGTTFNLQYAETAAGTTKQFQVAVDGGGAVNVAGTGSVDRVSNYSVTGLTEGAHSIVITASGGNYAIPINFNWHSGKGVIVEGYGMPSYASTEILSASATTPLQAMCPGGADNATYTAGATANLLIFECGYNDIQKQISLGTTPDVFAAVVQRIVDRQALVGGCTLLMDFPPVPTGVNPVPAGGVYVANDYRQRLKDIALKTAHCAYLDGSSLFFDDWARAKASGLFSDSSSIHPLRAGYGRWSQALFSLLRAPVLA